ncbi:hypothetical protein WISP_113860 [Willisornis vidua]|uniref:Uncharacterized protein n=1 Tax=Willisornis vidua TaxID=1566151 RepID=A0ABQ9CVJ4_9PASS|nr:hypothetical protein WISP_113860 [Willisornis vidua]
MKFDKGKCQILSLGNSNLRHKYILAAGQLESYSAEKDIKLIMNRKHIITAKKDKTRTTSPRSLSPTFDLSPPCQLDHSIKNILGYLRQTITTRLGQDMTKKEQLREVSLFGLMERRSRENPASGLIYQWDIAE